MRCNICEGTRFGHQGTRENVRCLNCSSLERTRAIKLHLDRLDAPSRGDRILHIAPERGIAEFLRERAGDGYEAVDLFPDLFPHVAARRFDLCTDAAGLPSAEYDLILHSHVLEHVPCNWTMVLLHLHRALKPGGHHLFAIPILSGHFEESLAPLPKEEAVRRFGQDDHVRRLGRADLERTLGMVFAGDLAEHALDRWFDAAILNAASIPEAMRPDLNSSTVFVFGKDELQLAV